MHTVRTKPAPVGYARYAMALGAARSRLEAVARAEGENWHATADAIKSAIAPGDTVTPGWAPELVPNIGGEFAAAVGPATLVSRIASWHRVPFDVPAVSGAAQAVASWAGQGLFQKLTVSSFASQTLPRRKVIGNLVESLELLRSSTFSAEATVGADMRRAMAKAIDTAMLDSTNDGASDSAPVSLTYNVTPISSSGVDAAAICADLAQAIQALSDAGSDLANACVIMSTRTAIALSLMLGSGGSPTFPGMTVAGGRIAGLPAFASPWMPIAATTGSPTQIVVCDPSQIWLADEQAAAIEVGEYGTAELSDSEGSGTVVSLWQRGLAALRLLRFLNWSPVRTGMTQVIDGVEI